jgi:hypothetical protein
MRRFAPQSPSFRFELRSFYADVEAVIADVGVVGCVSTGGRIESHRLLQGYAACLNIASSRY